MVYNHISEYLGSHIFELLDIPVQDTKLGIYKGENIVLLKNFCQEGEILTHFNDVGESSLEEDKEMYQYFSENASGMFYGSFTAEIMVNNLQKLYQEVLYEK